MKSKIFFILINLISFSISVDYLKNAQYWVDIVYQKIYDVQCKHEAPHPRAFEEIQKLKRINCGSSVSITYQQAGMIDKGKRTGHTPAAEGTKDYKSYYDSTDLKQSLYKSVTNPKNFKKNTCDFVKVMQRYEDMADWLKIKGIMYVQNSNICISAGKNKIYSCNSTGHVYGEGKSKVLRTDMKHEAAFRTLTLWAVVPRTNGKSNIPVGTPYKHLPCGL